MQIFSFDVIKIIYPTIIFFSLKQNIDLLMLPSVEELLQ